ncbi:MAG: hypothetical protein VR69_12440 [Peptococcaceae bacterium BRH_c4b]|nr:MAG: hypothetical protein VR69_12440 [Peptococcaceae bacterium BRH_c4b]
MTGGEISGGIYLRSMRQYRGESLQARQMQILRGGERQADQTGTAKKIRKTFYFIYIIFT